MRKTEKKKIVLARWLNLASQARASQMDRLAFFIFFTSYVRFRLKNIIELLKS